MLLHLAPYITLESIPTGRHNYFLRLHHLCMVKKNSNSIKAEKIMQFNKIRKKIHVLVIALFIFPAIPRAAYALPAFPGAQGWGSDTVGGRSPSAKLYKVNTLADSNTGSCSGNICTGTLRYALTASGPRFVIFTVGGTITLGSTITVYDPYLNIAG